MLLEAEGRINYFLTLALTNVEIRQRMSLKYVSQMWDRHPYWYLWFEDIRGVYKISMQNVLPLQDTGWEANCFIYYYPHPTEPTFKSLSAVERMLRRSKIFAGKPSQPGDSCPCCGGGARNESHFSDLSQEIGVPSCSFTSRIAEDVFFVGGLTVKFETEQAITFSLTTQTEWQVRAVTKFTVSDLAGRIFYTVQAGELDRRLPGVLICEPLLHHLVDGWSTLFGTNTGDLITNEEVGIAFDSDGNNLEARETAAIKKVSLSVRLQG